MPALIYRCPQTTLKVQGFVAEEIGDNEFILLTCLACAGAHFVNPTSAKVLGEDDDGEDA